MKFGGDSSAIQERGGKMKKLLQSSFLCFLYSDEKRRSEQTTI